MGLSPCNMTLMAEYRDLIEAQELQSIKFTIFPKEGLEKKGGLTVLLRENFRNFVPECLPGIILARSRKLKGGLKVTHVKTYSSSDRSRAGASKKGWRLIYLQGCPVFMESLKHYDQEYKFPLGCGQVLIRGGAGRPKSILKNVGARSSPGGRGRGQQFAIQQQMQQSLRGQVTGRPGQHQQQQQYQQQQQSFVGHKSYDRQFPDPDVSAVSRGRGQRGTGARRPGWATAGDAADVPDLGAWSSRK